MDVLLQLRKEIGKAMPVPLFDVFNGCSSSIKKINRLIRKGMSHIYYWEKPTFSKLPFSRKENLKKCTNFEEQKGTMYIRGNVYIGIIVISCLSPTKVCLRFLWNCFIREIKGFYQSSFGNEADFRDIMHVSLNILANNENFTKLRHWFVDEDVMIKTTLMSSWQWKTLVHFCLRKKRSENALLTLTVNYREIVQKNKLRHSNQ